MPTVTIYLSDDVLKKILSNLGEEETISDYIRDLIEKAEKAETSKVLGED